MKTSLLLRKCDGCIVIVEEETNTGVFCLETDVLVFLVVFVRRYVPIRHGATCWYRPTAPELQVL
jgi:hypothetical protein